MMSFRQEWRLLRTGPGEPAWNMALDEALWRTLSAAKDKQPVLRLYRWTVPTLSLGRYQPSSGVDLHALRDLGIALVRRPTGGRAVLHDLELTYSLVHPLAGMGSVLQAHKAIHRALARGLRRLGLDVTLTTNSDKTETGTIKEKLREKGKTIQTEACFAAPALTELTVDGRKVVGSAQVRDRHTLLEHGSLPLALRPDILSRLLRPRRAVINGREQRREHDQEQLSAILARRAAGLREFLPDLSFPELEQAVIAGFAELFTIDLVPDEPSARELELAQELLKKYRSQEWTINGRWERSPGHKQEIIAKN